MGETGCCSVRLLPIRTDHALKERGELGRRWRDTRVWFGGRDDLQTEVLREVRPAVVHDHDLRAAKRREGFYPAYVLPCQCIDKGSRVCIEVLRILRAELRERVANRGSDLNGVLWVEPVVRVAERMT